MIEYRTDLDSFVLDQLDFIECKLREARDDAASQKGAVTEASGIIPQVRDRLWAENEKKATQCLLVFPKLVERDAEEWWRALAAMERKKFLLETQDLLDPVNGAIAGARLVFQ